MIDAKAFPAIGRTLEFSAIWNASGEDFVPSAESIAAKIRRHDQTYLAALHSASVGTANHHLLYERWVHLDGPLLPQAAAPFRHLAKVCRDVGWGFSAALTLEDRDETPALITVARQLTRLEFHLPPESVLADADVLNAIDQLALTGTSLVLCGDIRRYRAIGATSLPSLTKRPHFYRAYTNAARRSVS